MIALRVVIQLRGLPLFIVLLAVVFLCASSGLIHRNTQHIRLISMHITPTFLHKKMMNQRGLTWCNMVNRNGLFPSE
jgi:uncharacterized membrane protein